MKRVIRKSFRRQLILSYIVISIIPIIAINIFSYIKISNLVKADMDELNRTNMRKTQSSLNVWLESYNDVLFKIYMDEEIVDMVKKLNQDKDIPIVRQKLRTSLHGNFYSKDYIKSISVITRDNKVVFFDALSGSLDDRTWEKNHNLNKKYVYEVASSDNDIHIFPTQKYHAMNDKKVDLFYVAHRIIDYKNVSENIGVVIVGIDEKMLQNIFNAPSNGESITSKNFYFVVDNNGRIISSPKRELIGTQMDAWKDKNDNNHNITSYVEQEFGLDGDEIMIYSDYNQQFQWNLINVTQKSQIDERLRAQIRTVLIDLVITLIVAIIIIVAFSEKLNKSIYKVIRTIKKAGKGDLSARVEPDPGMNTEIRTIADEFNNMIDRLQHSVTAEKEAINNQREAEIMALEAQINPHFLYNTLDTINWMAIDKDEYEISNAINALANILRYGIENSNGIVTISKEVEWLKKYLFLQQTRLKNKLISEINVQPGIMRAKIHKLLLQPFIENAILHAFEGVEREYKLTVDMKSQGDKISIKIRDNGCGIQEKIIRQLNSGVFIDYKDKQHIGIKNSINRLEMYYGKDAYFNIQSTLGQGTCVEILIPIIGEDDYENRDC